MKKSFDEITIWILQQKTHSKRLGIPFELIDSRLSLDGSPDQVGQFMNRIRPNCLLSLLTHVSRVCRLVVIWFLHNYNLTLLRSILYNSYI